MITKQIFVGSSSEALDQAKLVAQILEAIPRVKALLWTEAFPIGALTFEGIEQLARRIAGAVLLATPDDPSTIRGKSELIPRTNVILEWGYLTALLGRDRVALCKYDGVYLPTDLVGLTYCPMGVFDKSQPVAPIIPTATTKIGAWAESLPGVAVLSPVAVAVHGYSSVWSMRITYTLWRGLSLADRDYVYFEGKLQLLLPLQGASGVGASYGKVFISVGANAVFRLTDIESDIRVDPNGSLTLISESYTRQVNEPIKGIPPQEDGFVDELPDPNRFEMRLTPDSEGRLVGEHVTLRGNHLRSKGEVICERLLTVRGC